MAYLWHCCVWLLVVLASSSCDKPNGAVEIRFANQRDIIPETAFFLVACRDGSLTDIRGGEVDDDDVASLGKGTCHGGRQGCFKLVVEEGVPLLRVMTLLSRFRE